MRPSRDGYNDRAVLAAFGDGADVVAPRTTAEVATALDRSHETTVARLEAATDAGLVDSRSVGETRLWWVTVGPAAVDEEGPSGPFSGLSNEDLFDRMSDAIPVGIAITDADRSIVYVNDRLVELLDHPWTADDRAADSLDVASVLETVRDEDGHPTGERDRLVGPAFETEAPVLDVRYQVVREDGDGVRWLSCNAAPLPAENGDVDCVVVSCADVTDRQRREARVRSQRSKLVRLDRVNAVVRGVSRAVVTARTREDIDRAICAAIAGSDQYLFAVLGEVSPSTTEFTLRASAGIGEDDLSAILDRPDGPSPDISPEATAAKTRQVQVLNDIPGFESEHRRQAPEDHRFRSVASVPLHHDGVVYGVLDVYAGEPEAFDGDERALLAELGETAGYGLYALEVTERLSDEQLVELTVRSDRLADRAVGVVSDRLRMTGTGLVDPDDNGALQYLSVTAPPRDALAAAGELGLGEVNLLGTTEGRSRLELRADPEGLVATLAAAAGEVRSITVDDTVTMVVRLPRPTDGPSAFDRLRAVCSDVEYVFERLVLDSQTFRALVDSVLTDRQSTALELAYHTGYYEQPRQVTGGDVADRMEVTSTTFHRHLRTAQKRVVEELYDTSWREP
jgi:PAS domain-containing protein/GAF domain-containing protein